LAVSLTCWKGVAQAPHFTALSPPNTAGRVGMDEMRGPSGERVEVVQPLTLQQVKMLRAAAERGAAVAQYKLGLHHLAGMHVEQSVAASSSPRRCSARPPSAATRTRRSTSHSATRRARAWRGT